MKRIIVASLALTFAGADAEAAVRRGRVVQRRRPVVVVPRPTYAVPPAPTQAPAAAPTAPQVAPAPTRGVPQVVGRRGLFARRPRPLVYAPPAVAPRPAYAAPPAPVQAAAPPAPTLASTPAPENRPAPEPEAAAIFDYTADGRTTPPYYATFDETGKLVTKPWSGSRAAAKPVGEPEPSVPLTERLP